jgi:Tol biopolymer transport system component
MFKRKIVVAALALSIPVMLAVKAAPQGRSEAGQASPEGKAVAAAVTRMARVGSAGSPSFSPDGKWVSFISNISGSPQVWIVPVEGGFPRMVTNGDDPVVQAEWSPAGDWIAVAIAPGGGLNTQVYVVKPDGTADCDRFQPE